MTKTLQIGSKGQIVLPKKIRDMFNSNIITLKIVDEDKVLISPVRNIGGALKKYKKNSDLPFSQIREEAYKISRETRKDT